MISLTRLCRARPFSQSSYTTASLTVMSAQAAAAINKRKASSASSPASKKAAGKRQRVDEDNGVVLRKYYPPEMTNDRAAAYNAGKIQRPIEELEAALDETAQRRGKVAVKDAVVHWFKADLRLSDNKALSMASAKAKEAGVPLICMYLVSPQDYEAHLTAPVRVDFILRTLEVMKGDLAKLDIPLHVETVNKRKDVPRRIVDLMDKWGSNHLFANMEYEVDELRREARLVRQLAERGKAFQVVHDTCVVPPGDLQTGSAKQYAVYSPWYRAWMAHIHENPHLLELNDPPAKNPQSARQRYQQLFDGPIPEAPENKRLTDQEKKKFRALWPCGEHEAASRLAKFCDEKVRSYGEKRNYPGENATSILSVHLSSGTISSRTCVRAARDKNKTKKLNGGDPGIISWISEVAWRDFYKHVLAHWPYVCMNKPFKPEYSNIEWSYDPSHFEAWTKGVTGFPIVDAAMRQLNHMGYLHNRCRMIVASFLSKDLLIDWRKGERYFMEHLVDGDFASNNGGWGFSASVGVDPQPYFRIFNPLLQSEKFDSDGSYIRKWVPELKELNNKQIHDPYGRGAGAEAEKKGYPKPIVAHKGARDRALSAYKEAQHSA